MKTYYQSFSSPLGRIHLVASESALLKVDFGSGWSQSTPGSYEEGSALLREAETQLREYFSGKRSAFTLPLAPKGTEFQQAAWAALQKIPYGTTVSYKEQAMSMQRPTAVRAVGRANGCNPIGIIVPCHRVIGSNGSLTGYAGGLDKKKELLALEASNRSR